MAKPRFPDRHIKREKRVALDHLPSPIRVILTSFSCQRPVLLSACGVPGHLLGPKLGMHVPGRLRQDVTSLE
jgi:hypothetical protein